MIQIAAVNDKKIFRTLFEICTIDLFNFITEKITHRKIQM